MKILKKLIIESIRKNRKRSILTVLGILLSTALILAVAGMVSSARATLIRFAKENEGDYHLLFYDVPEEKLSYIDSHANVADSFRIQMLGYAAFPNSNSRTRPYYLLQGCSGEALSRIRLQLKSGRLPENESEVVVSEPAVYNGGMQVELGSTLHLALGERRDETGAVLTEYTVYEEDHPETLENTIEKEYTIVGVAAESNTLSGFYASSYHLYTCLTPEEMAQGDGLYAVGVTLADVQKLSATIADLQENIYEDRAPDYMYYYGMNGELLRYEGAVGTDLIQVLRRIAAVVVVIILLTSVFVIRNSFRMSVSEKTRQYGMLISVGATGKQIRKSVLLEGLYLGLIGIPASILLGIAAVFALTGVLNVLLPDLAGNGTVIFQYSVPPLVILTAAAVGAVTIFLSCYFPALRAAKIAPVEAIRGSREIQLSSKSLRKMPLVQRTFGIGGVIAARNLQRSRKKYRTTVVSLVLSISVFVALSSLVAQGRRAASMTYTDYAWNLSVVGGFEKTNAETESLYRQLLEMDGIRDGMYHFSLMLYCDADVYGTPYAQEQLANLTWSDPYGNVHQADHQMQTELVLVSREYFARYLEELGIDETPEKAAVLVDDTIAVGYEKEGVRSIQHFYRTDEGETVRYQFSPREDIADGAQSHEKEIRITARTDRRPMGFENYYSDGSFLFVSEDYENGWFLTDGVAVSGTLYLDAADANETEAAIMEWRSRDPALYWVSVQNIEKSADQDRRFILVLEIFLYGFIAVITLIGVTNIFNTISTNMLLRSREFAMLKSIGMTKKEFGRMVRLESLMYGVKSLVIGALTGIAGSVILYALLADSVDLGYRFPLVPILISAAAVFLIVGGTMWYSTAKINRQNIVETIRRETF